MCVKSKWFVELPCEMSILNRKWWQWKEKLESMSLEEPSGRELLQKLNLHRARRLVRMSPSKYWPRVPFSGTKWLIRYSFYFLLMVGNFLLSAVSCIVENVIFIMVAYAWGCCCLSSYFSVRFHCNCKLVICMWRCVSANSYNKRAELIIPKYDLFSSKAS